MSKEAAPKIHLIESKEKKKYTIALIVIFSLYLMATAFTQFNPFEFFFKMNNFWSFIFNDMIPPSYNRVTGLEEAVLQTLSMSFGASFLAGILALLLSFLGSNTTSPSPILIKIVRGLASVKRNIPSLIWAFILVMAFGIGTTVGLLALTLESTGFLVRAFIEIVDEVGNESIEALDAVGASFFQKMFQCIIPASLPGMISWLLYSLEVNIRASTIVGAVGGGGIGLVLLGYLRLFKYHTTFGVIIVVVALVLVVDFLTNFMRKKLLV